MAVYDILSNQFSERQDLHSFILLFCKRLYRNCDVIHEFTLSLVFFGTMNLLTPIPFFAKNKNVLI